MAQENVTTKDEKKRRRRRSAEMVAEIILEVERTGNRAAVCRREGIAPAQFTRWKQKFKEGGIGALKEAKRGPKLKDSEKEALEREVAKLKEALCEVTIENQLLKKRTS